MGKLEAIHSDRKSSSAAGHGQTNPASGNSVVLNGIPITVNSKERNFIITYSRFYEYRHHAGLFLEGAFEDLDPNNLFTYGVEDYMFALEQFLTDAEKIMKYFGDSDFSGKEMLKGVIDDLPGMRKWYETSQTVAAIEEKYRRMQRSQQSRPNSYGVFSGRNVSGAIKAGLLNMATDFIAGAAEQAIDNNRKNSIYREMEAVFKDLLVNKSYLRWFAFDCKVLTTTLLNYLINNNFLEKCFDPRDYGSMVPDDVVYNIMKSSRIDEAHYNESVSNLIELIQKRPYDHVLYAALCMINPKFKDELTDFFEANKMTEAFLWVYEPDHADHCPCAPLLPQFSLD